MASVVKGLEFTVIGRKNKKLSTHLHSGAVIVAKGDEWLTSWLQQWLDTNVQRLFGAGTYSIYDVNGKSQVPVDVLAFDIYSDAQSGAAALVNRHGKLADGVLQLRLKLHNVSGEAGTGPDSAAGSSRSAASRSSSTRAPQAGAGLISAFNNLHEFHPRFMSTAIVYSRDNIDSVAATWDEVPDNANIDWGCSTFKGQIIGNDGRASAEQRWPLLVATMVQTASLLTNGTDELTVKDKLDRRILQFNKGVENTHKVQRHAVHPLPADQLPGEKANKQPLRTMKKGAPAGAEVEADEWHARYGTLYANRNQEVTPGSNQYRLPSKLTTLLQQLQASAPTAGPRSRATTEEGRGANVQGGSAAAGHLPSAAGAAAGGAGPPAGLGPVPASTAGGVGRGTDAGGTAAMAAGGSAGAAIAERADAATDSPPEPADPSDLDAALDAYMSRIDSDAGAPVADSRGLAPNSTGSMWANGVRRSPRLASSDAAASDRQGQGMLPFGAAQGPGQQQQAANGRDSGPPPGAAAAAAAAAINAAGTAAGEDLRRSGRQQERQQQQQQQQQELLLQQQRNAEQQQYQQGLQQQPVQAPHAQLEEIKARIAALRTAGLSDVDIRNSISGPLFDAAVNDMHPTQQEMRRQGGNRAVVGKLPTAAERAAAREGRQEAAALRKAAAKKKRKADDVQQDSRKVSKPNSSRGRAKNKSKEQQESDAEYTDSCEADDSEAELSDASASEDEAEADDGGEQHLDVAAAAAAATGTHNGTGRSQRARKAPTTKKLGKYEAKLEACRVEGSAAADELSVAKSSCDTKDTRLADLCYQLAQFTALLTTYGASSAAELGEMIKQSKASCRQLALTATVYRGMWRATRTRLSASTAALSKWSDRYSTLEAKYSTLDKKHLLLNRENKTLNIQHRTLQHDFARLQHDKAAVDATLMQTRAELSTVRTSLETSEGTLWVTVEELVKVENEKKQQEAESAELAIHQQQRISTTQAALTAEKATSSHLSSVKSLLQQQVLDLQDTSAADAETSAKTITALGIVVQQQAGTAAVERFAFLRAIGLKTDHITKLTDFITNLKNNQLAKQQEVVARNVAIWNTKIEEYKADCEEKMQQREAGWHKFLRDKDEEMSSALERKDSECAAKLQALNVEWRGILQQAKSKGYKALEGAESRSESQLQQKEVECQDKIRKYWQEQQDLLKSKDAAYQKLLQEKQKLDKDNTLLRDVAESNFVDIHALTAERDRAVNKAFALMAQLNVQAVELENLRKSVV